MTIKLIIKDEVNIKIVGLPATIRDKLIRAFTHDIPGAKYQPAYRLGRWDGKVSLFSMGGNCYLNQLPKIIDILKEHKYEIEELEDHRKPGEILFEPITETYWADKGKVWPEGHALEGKPIMLRDYQVTAINTFFQHPQAVNILATGAGKCLIGLTEINVLHNGIIKTITFNDIEQQLLLNGTALIHDTEVNIKHLKYQILTPANEYVDITHFIKKEQLDVIAVHLENGYSFTGSSKHIVCDQFNQQVFLDQLSVGEFIQHKTGLVKITHIILHNEARDCYDISIANPHLYCDANGVIHHNTITSATMAHSCEKYGRTITIVPNKSLVRQTYEDFNAVDLDVGVYYGDKKELNKTHTICTWQSFDILDKRKHDSAEDYDKLTDFLHGVSAILVDECHGAKSNSLVKILAQCTTGAPIRWGFTGTLPKEEYQKQLIFSCIGPVVGTLYAHELQEQGVLAKCHVNIIQTTEVKGFPTYQDELTYLITDSDRVKFIASLCAKVVETGNTLVLVDRVESGELLQGLLPNSVFISGKMKTDDRKAIYDKTKVENDMIIIATSALAAVGINIVNLHNVVLLEAGKSFVKVIQSIGRGLRKGENKDFVNIWDVSSTCKFSKRHLVERISFYKESRYPFSKEQIDYLKK
jgi:superfamily II DNA or RNA helicase